MDVICNVPRQKLHATIFDPLRPPRLEVEPDAAEDVRRRETDSASLNDTSETPSSCGPGGAESVAMGGSSVCMDCLREPLACGTPNSVVVAIGGRVAEPSSRGSTAALRGGSVSVRSMLTFELLRECGADDDRSGECDGWSRSAVPSSMLSPSLSLPYCFRCLPELRRLLLAV